ncbi:MAG: Outer rane autotransporter barrel, partial [Bradyrhizobium sp.]|nr:Outer rane autotransporter barrel [Bradyrhizobium sp.]
MSHASVLAFADLPFNESRSSRPGVKRARAALLGSTALVALSLAPTPARAVDVSNAAELQAAILALNAGGADHTINVTQSIVLDPGAANQLTAITQAVDITGAGPGISITGTGAVAEGHG